MEYKYIIAYVIFTALLSLYGYLEAPVCDSRGNIIGDSYFTKWKQKRWPSYFFRLLKKI